LRRPHRSAMVCLSVAVLSKSGKVLLSRQFVDMSRIRIEGLLAAFPKLVGTGNKQHTFVETDKVRYVYQPVEGLYFLMITNKQSNIIEDLETLRLLTKLAPEYCHGIDEESILKHQFELIFALDEVISLGYKENVNMVHIRAYTEMESHEEKLANMIKASKINEAKEEMKRKVTQIDKQKAEQRKGGHGDGSMMEGFGKALEGSLSSSSLGASSAFGGAEVYRAPEEYAKPAVPAGKTIKAGSGMQLGKKKDKVDLMAMMQEEGLDMGPGPGAAGGQRKGSASGAGAGAAAAAGVGLTLNVEEKIVATLGRDGGVQSLEVKGDLQLLVSDPSAGKLTVAVSFGDNPGFQFKTHPNINKQLFADQSILGLKDASRSFPPGNALGVLKWRLQTTDAAMVPLTVNCWPSVAADGTCEVSMEYELVRSGMELGDVTMTIPFPPGCAAPKTECEAGEATYSARNNALVWAIPLINRSNSSGTLEFTVAGVDAASLFPIAVDFKSTKTFCDMVIGDVVNLDNNQPIRFVSATNISVESYSIV